MNADESIVKLVELVASTVSQTVTTTEEKDKIIEQAKAQIKSLKAILQAKDTAKKCQKEKHSEEIEEKTRNRTSSAESCLQPNMFEGSVKTPEEDELNNWQMCACEETDCTTCSAEREASVAATEWFDSQTLYNQVLSAIRGTEDRDGETEICACTETHCTTCSAKREASVSATEQFDSQTHYNPARINSQTHYNPARINSQGSAPTDGEIDTPLSVGSVNDQTQEYTEMQVFWCHYDPLYHKTGQSSMHIVLLHPLLSVTGFQGPASHPYPCGIVTLQFAEQMLRAFPGRIQLYHEYLDMYLSNKVYHIVLSCLKDGTDIYKANYSEQHKCLNLTDVVLMNSHLNVRLQEEIKLESHIIEMLTSYIINLEKDELLLFSRQKDYNVWSVVRGGDKHVIIYDCQSYQWEPAARNPPFQCGGIIYFIAKNSFAIMRTLILGQSYSGNWQGPVTVGIVHTH